MGEFEACFSGVADPRGRNAQHNLVGILFMALLALLCGAESCVDMADFARAKRGLLASVLDLRHGTPSHDTFSRVFRRLDPVGFEAGFRRFTAAFGRAIGQSGVVALDGKAVKGAYAKGAKATPLHLVNVWSARARMAIGQTTAPGRSEVAGLLQAIAMLDLEGAIVTADALHCRTDVIEAVLAKKAHYVLALKSNHPKLLADVTKRLEGGARKGVASSATSLSHGRTETRTATVMRAGAIGEIHAVPGLTAIASVTAHRQEDGKATVISTRYFLLSRPMRAAHLLNVVRQHWGIENSLHWVLDVALKEDSARNRKDHGPENIAILRKIALNLLQAHPENASIRRKIKRAGWQDDFLLSLFANMR